MLRKKTQTVLGHQLPSPRVTRDGFVMMLAYFAAPMMAFLIGVDVLLYVFFRVVYGECYGVWCWF
ncbi:MAG: hypothetical protein AAGA09_05755 [Pseudomonadota bacterium]